MFNQLVKIEQSITIKESLEIAPLISTLGTKIEVITSIINVLEFFLKVTGKELEDYQIQILAGDLYDKFKTDTLEDVIIMLKMARTGEFGKIYKCETFEIMDWCNKYLEVKSATREKLLKAPCNPEPIKVEGKFFNELPKEIQEKFNRIGKPKEVQPFINPRATDLLTHEKMKREILKKLENEK